ncbi:glycosyltransferase family 4 protein [Pendulispora rubella]|uniref:Glycosyltransferase family 4 protein n=1 Tax=Pendulispora rubella TaxID=2741070 RepID=A0ABZ2LG15_9BACT
MIHVLHVVVAGEVGGAERMLCDLASRPEASDALHTIALMTPNPALRELFARAELRVRDRSETRTVHEGPLSFLWSTIGPRDVAWLVEIARAESAQIVQLHTFASQVAGTRAALRLGLPVLRTEHSTRVYDDPSCWPFSRWSLRRAQSAVFVSEHVRRAALNKDPAVFPRARVVRNGVDTERFAYAPPPARGPFTFALVGRLERRKGVDRAIDALRHVAEARLEIVGDGAERARLETMAKECGVEARVRFHGMLSDPREVLQRSHAALCSSREEGLGIANLEAMAIGRPVVASPVGGVPEIVQDGVTGLLALDMSVPALVLRMHDAVKHRDKMIAFGEAARKFVVDRCSIDAMCRAYGRIYAELL